MLATDMTNQTFPSIPDGYILIKVNDLQKISNGQISTGSMMTLDEFLEKHFWPDKANLRFLTLRGYRSHVKRFISPFLGSTPLANINYSEIQQMLNNCPTQKAAKDAKGTLSSILGHAVKLQMISSNPAIASYILPDYIPPDTPAQGVWLTDFSQIMEVLRAARAFDDGGELERLCLIGYGFGLRKGEILGIDTTDLHFESNSIKVLRSFTRGEGGPELHGLKTITSLRELPMFDYVEYRLKEICQAIDEPGPFITYNGYRSNPSSIAKRFQAFREQKGLPSVTIATMRHSFATAMIREGRSIPTVQQWLGHTSPVTTMNYLHSTLEDLKRDAEYISSKMTQYFYNKIVNYPKVTNIEMRKIQRVLADCEEEIELEKMVPYLDPKPAPNREKIIQELIAHNPTITKEKMADYLGISMTSTKRIISNLKKANLIKHVGPSKGGHWALVA